MDEIDILMEKSEETLGAAQTLLKEGYIEDAISRAYYSMFLVAKALLKTKEFETKSHKGLIAKFGLEFVEKGIIEAEFGRAIHEAEGLREEADYSVFRKISKEEAETVTDNAERFVERIKKAIKEIKAGENG